MNIRWLVLAFILFSLQSIVNATDYTWEGATDGNWSNTLNWAASQLPYEYGGYVADSSHRIIIQNSTYMPTSNVPDFQTASTGGGTPHFVIESGAAFTIKQRDGGWDGIVARQSQSIVDVAAGGSLTFGNNDANNWISLSRHNGSMTYNISGTFTIDITTLHFTFNPSYYSTFDLDGGTMIHTGTTLQGTRYYAGFDFSDHNRIFLNHGAVFNATNAPLDRTIEDGGTDPIVVFDIQDSKSSIKFKVGGDFNTIENVEAKFGINFISSTKNNYLRVTEDGGIFTIVSPPQGSIILLF